MPSKRKGLEGDDNVEEDKPPQKKQKLIKLPTKPCTHKEEIEERKGKKWINESVFEDDMWDDAIFENQKCQFCNIVSIDPCDTNSYHSIEWQNHSMACCDSQKRSMIVCQKCFESSKFQDSLCSQCHKIKCPNCVRTKKTYKECHNCFFNPKSNSNANSNANTNSNNKEKKNDNSEWTSRQFPGSLHFGKNGQSQESNQNKIHLFDISYIKEKGVIHVEIIKPSKLIKNDCNLKMKRNKFENEASSKIESWFDANGFRKQQRVKKKKEKGKTKENLICPITYEMKGTLFNGYILQLEEQIGKLLFEIDSKTFCENGIFYGTKNVVNDPKCKCGNESRLFTTRNTEWEWNIGRKYYACNNKWNKSPNAKKCDFWKWADGTEPYGEQANRRAGHFGYQVGHEDIGFGWEEAMFPELFNSYRGPFFF